jgi:hypothetical protein
MSASPEPSPGPSRAIPLGRLLIQRGLLTEEQLIQGLFEQNRTGDRLGKILIDLGFVDAPTVAMALATQHGGPLKTEYGFATGLGLPEPTEPETNAPPDADPATSPALAAEAADLTAERDAARTELEAAQARIADLEQELAVTREQLDERQSKAAELEDQLAAARLAAETAIAALQHVTDAAR